MQQINRKTANNKKQSSITEVEIFFKWVEIIEFFKVEWLRSRLEPDSKVFNTFKFPINNKEKKKARNDSDEPGVFFLSWLGLIVRNEL